MGTYSPTYINSFYNDTDLTDCGNGICDEGENCLSCAVDCISGTSGGFECGNDVCEDGETCFTCPSDCMSSGQIQAMRRRTISVAMVVRRTLVLTMPCPVTTFDAAQVEYSATVRSPLSSHSVVVMVF